MKEALENESYNELNALSPLLADLKKRQANDAFKTPKFYFDNLADSVLAEAKRAEKTAVLSAEKTPQYISLWARFQGFLALLSPPKLAVAFASIALVVGASWYGLTRQSAGNGVNQARIVENQPQISVNQSPVTIEILPTVEPKTAATPSTPTVFKDVPNAEIETYITDNLMDITEDLAVENTPKRAHTEGSKLTHSESDLTEEELEIYLKDAIEDSDSDGIDNQF